LRKSLINFHLKNSLFGVSPVCPFVKRCGGSATNKRRKGKGREEEVSLKECRYFKSTQVKFVILSQMLHSFKLLEEKRWRGGEVGGEAEGSE
jgi:hypothetical protein